MGNVIMDICKQIDAWNYELVDGYNDGCMVGWNYVNIQ